MASVLVEVGASLMVEGDHDDELRLVVDLTTKRFACVLLQAARGGNHAWVSRNVPSDLWDVAPQDGHRLVTGTHEQFEKVVEMAAADQPIGDGADDE